MGAIVKGCISFYVLQISSETFTFKLMRFFYVDFKLTGVTISLEERGMAK